MAVADSGRIAARLTALQERLDQEKSLSEQLPEAARIV